MSLTLETSLRGIAHALSERIAPALADPFAIEAARLAQILLAISANAVDDLAAVRVREHGALRELFAEAAPLAEPALAAELRAAAAGADADLRISALDRETARLRGLLVRLHTAVEEREEDAARTIDARIWRLLAEVEAARAPRTDPPPQADGQ